MRTPRVVLEAESLGELNIDGVVKCYGSELRAVDGVSFATGPGIVGLLGPNGAGKSTLMQMLVGLSAPDEGTITFWGHTPHQEDIRFKRVVGYLPQDFGLYPELSASALLDHLAALRGIGPRLDRAAQVEQTLRALNLWELRGLRVGGFSGGMRQRLGIAQALIGQPRLIVLDEPTAGLDPEERYRLLELLAAKRREAVIVLSTHVVRDVADLCQRALILHSGRLVADVDPAVAPALLRECVWRIAVLPEDADSLIGLRVLHRRMVGGRVVAHCIGRAAPRADAIPICPDLEDFYFAQLLAATENRGARALGISTPSRQGGELPEES